MKIRIDEQQNVPFSFQLPFDTPVLFDLPGQKFG